MHPLQEERLRHIPFKQIEDLGNAIESVPIYLPYLAYTTVTIYKSCKTAVLRPPLFRFPLNAISHAYEYARVCRPRACSPILP